MKQYLIKPWIEPQEDIIKIVESMPDKIDKENKPEEDLKEIETSKQNNLETILNPVNFVPSDFINLKTKDYEFDISISESLGLGKDWYNQNKEALKNGYIMSNVLESMTFFNEIMGSHFDKKKILFDSAGNPIKREIVEDLFKFLTTDHKKGSWFNINAFFENKNGILIMKSAKDYNLAKDELVYLEKQISPQIMENCYVDFKDLDEHGFPKIQSSDQKYLQGKNILYWKPVDKMVARFYADSDGADLYCNGSPSITDDSLGYRAVRRE